MSTGAIPARRTLRPRARIAAALDDLLYRVVRLVTRPSRRLRRHLEHSPLTGRLVEVRGNVVSVEGLRFSVDSPAISPAAKAPFVYGSYESAERRLLRAHLDPALPVVELGGSIGVISCLVNRRLDDPTAHIVIEANPALVPLLRANRERNGCEFRIVHGALAYGTPEVTFGSADIFTAGSAIAAAPSPEGEAVEGVRVPAVTLGEVLRESGASRCTLVCDVEGAEWGMVEHDAAVLRERVETLVIELHPEPGTGRGIEQLAARIAAAGFGEVDRKGETCVFRAIAEPQLRYQA